MSAASGAVTSARRCLYAQGVCAVLVAIALTYLAIATDDDIRTYGYPALQGATVDGLATQAVAFGASAVCFLVVGSRLARSLRWRRFALVLEILVLVTLAAAAPSWLASSGTAKLAWLLGASLAALAIARLVRSDGARSFDES